MDQIAALLFLACAVIKIVQSLKSNDGKFEQIFKRLEKINTKCKFREKNYETLNAKIDRLINSQHRLSTDAKEEYLIFDDDEESAWLLAEKIRSFKKDIEITTTYNLDNAMALVSIKRFTLILADVRHHYGEYGPLLKQIMDEQKIETRFILYSF